MAKINVVRNVNKKRATRNIMNDPVFGAPSAMSPNVLPTYGDVMKQYLLRKYKLKSVGDTKEPSFTAVANSVICQVENLWQKASIPIISHQKVLEKLKLYHDRYRSLLKPYKSRQHSAKYQIKIKDFQADSLLQLFDIAACKCFDIGSCNCKKDRKVPAAERNFLQDQRQGRTMMMGGVDLTMTKRLQQRNTRKNIESTKRDKFVQLQSEAEAHDTSLSSSSIENEEMSNDGNELDTDLSGNRALGQIATQMRSSLSNLARECDRHGVSDRCAAALATAVLQDVGLVKGNDCSMVIDRSKVRRERKRKRKELQSTSLKKRLFGIYFDGRKDKTRTQVKRGKKSYPKIVLEEHICLVQEPNSEYLGHVTPDNGTSKSIHEAIFTFLQENEIDTSNIVAIGCDGTNVNTGALGGVVCLLEKKLNRPIHWFVCMLHANELPLRHLFQKLDGGTHGPKAFSGVIGKALMNCETLPIVAYSPIALGICPNMDEIELSTDQKYLYNICKAVDIGHCSCDLAFQKPGPVCHSRWLTTANRILRLYVATENPTGNLVTLATFVMSVYSPMWFNIKTKSACTEGSRHLWRLIQYSRYLEQRLRDVVDEVIQRNGYFCHAENILLTMLTDDRRHVRELAYRRILAARNERAPSSTGIREFRVPRLNFDASDYTELVNWQEIDRCEPPLLMNFSDARINECVKSNVAEHVLEIAQFPCHTQGTERCIRLVTEAAASVCSSLARDGFIRARIASRKLMTTFNTKSEFRLG